MRFALPLCFALLLVGCERDTAPTLASDISRAESTTISALDSLAGDVSINGRVVDQRSGERTLILDDGTGLVRVDLPEALPILVGHRLFVQGTLRREDDGPVLDAQEWLYDSTAVSVRSE